MKKLKKLTPGTGLVGTPSWSRNSAEWMYCPMTAAAMSAAPPRRYSAKMILTARMLAERDFHEAETRV